MATNITVKDLTAYSDSGSFIRDLSDAELDLQGGKKYNPTLTIISDTPFVPPDIQTLDLSNILLGFAPYSIF